MPGWIFRTDVDLIWRTRGHGKKSGLFSLDMKGVQSSSLKIRVSTSNFHDKNKDVVKANAKTELVVTNPP